MKRSLNFRGKAGRHLTPKNLASLLDRYGVAEEFQRENTTMTKMISRRMDATRFKSRRQAVAIAENHLDAEGWQTDVIAAGMGGWLIQIVGRVGEDDHDKPQGFYCGPAQ